MVGPPQRPGGHQRLVVIFIAQNYKTNAVDYDFFNYRIGVRDKLQRNEEMQRFRALYVSMNFEP